MLGASIRPVGLPPRKYFGTAEQKHPKAGIRDEQTSGLSMVLRHGRAQMTDAFTAHDQRATAAVTTYDLQQHGWNMQDGS